MNQKNFIITTMDEKEIQDIFIPWANAEGWNPGLKDANYFYAQNPHGFFKGVLNGEVIGCCAATIYDENFAFFGCYIVKSEFRHQGYGIQLTHHRLNYVGDRNIGLDGVIDMCPKYERIGFRSAHLNIRYQSQGDFTPVMDDHIAEISEELRPLVEAYDRLYFPAPRKLFLAKWLIPANHHVPLAYVVNGEVKGYGVLRRCFKGYKIGPLFAETFEIADKIFQGLAFYAKEGCILIDVPEPNAFALRLVERYHMQPCFKTLRMYTKGAPDINLNHVYGMTTLELG